MHAENVIYIYQVGVLLHFAFVEVIKNHNSMVMRPRTGIVDVKKLSERARHFTGAFKVMKLY